jgi:protein-tyrosine-phosphatase
MGARIAERGVDGSCGSVGLLKGGRTCPEPLVVAMDAHGIDVSGHVSRQITPRIIETSALIVTAERVHVREVAIKARGSFGRTFTLKELVRRGSAVGSRDTDQSLEDWVALAAGERTPSDLLGSSPIDDIADPYLGTAEDYEETCRDLDLLTHQLTDLIWPPPEPVQRGREAQSVRRVP